MTSSSCRDLPEFFREVSTVTGVKRFDLMVLRDTDIVSIGAYLGKLGISPPWHPDSDPVGLCSMTEILTDLPYFSYIQKWIVEQCHTSGVEISALATYFSHVTSLDSAARDSAVKALINTVRLALALDDAGIMKPPVIEIVCGTILDPCKCDDCKRDARVFESTRPAKLSLLLDSLLAVVRAVHGNQVYEDRAFAIGLELEPGETYVLNGIQAMGDIVSMIDADPRYAALRGHVGFNMDVTHMRAADVPAHALEPFQDRFVHAHICDQPPGMHTRDQAIGTWSCVDRHVIDPGDRGYYPYLQILARRLDAVAAGRNPYNLPFTGTIALELEGCNRIDWIRRSLATLKHMIEATQNYL
jgi:sugar phosphate isomerase/epimerase